MRNKVAESMANLGACDEAVEWLDAEDFASLQAAWDKCHRAEWMMWLVRQRGETPRNKLVSITVQCARLALPYVQGKTVRESIARSLDTTEAWTRGEATALEVRTARDAAVAAAGAAAASATYAAADAASAAAYAADAANPDAAYAAVAYAVAYADSAASAAAYATDASDAATDAAGAARATVQAQCADIIRAVLPIAPSLG